MRRNNDIDDYTNLINEGNYEGDVCCFVNIYTMDFEEQLRDFQCDGEGFYDICECSGEH